ncbi:hypothetical protein B0T17DRAFT_155599 [Bombardia bombarda]|uniref:BHLH domain-containing protein n=1 Tax=Bombardia bombarda TaxID=252184 RepID=A0AA40C8U9_9PEZI|nr:hypothetical protein B0T17DRAFT_155599 [Bombardia bombarda]
MEQQHQQQTQQQRPASQKFPLGLAGVLNAPEENRDSAYYSSTDASSKHTSAASGMGVLTPAGSGFRTSPVDKTPSPTTTSNLLPQPLVSPITSNMSVASMVSPTTPGAPEQRRYDQQRPLSLDSGPNSATFAFNDMPEALSRRESVDSRMNQGFNDMRLGASPYASHNQSTTSIHNTLQQQRNPRPNLEALSVHRISNGYQPNAERNPENQKTLRVAPAITGPTTSHIARAAEPTKGQAWAFPEEEIQRLPSSVASQSLNDSRRSSIAESMASSQYTTESRLPPGQRRLDDGMIGDNYHRMSSASNEFSTIHHHSLQHKQIGDLQSEDGGLHGGSQPYSRTPELRVSHKLAERKRRTEMKELFEQLRDMMPQERGSKASKWEILTKAISEHQRQQDNLRNLQQHNTHQQIEIDRLRRDLNDVRMQVERLSRGQQGIADPYTTADQYGRSRPELPPLRAMHSSSTAVPPELMTGVQYEAPRADGYRQLEVAEARY